MPKISLIIPTYNRDKVLVDTLNYALKQDFKDYKVIVIDQNESHAQDISDFFKSLPSFIRIIKHLPPSSPSARNRAIEEARSPILIFIDDDVIFKENFISEHFKYHDKSKIGCVTGKVDQKSKYSNKIPLFIKSEFLQWISVKKFQQEDFKIAFRSAGGNMSFPRELAQRIGGYDENFIGTAWGEEYDFSLRLKEQGYIILYNPFASIFHLNTQTGGVNNRSRFNEKTVYSKGHNLTYLITKNCLGKWPLCFLFFYTWKQLFFKKDYLSLKGAKFISKGFIFFIKGLYDGYNDALKIKQNHSLMKKF